MMSTQWPRFEVFQQDRPERPHQNVGSVHAPDAEMALQNARDVFVRRPDCLNIWVVAADVILAKTAQELEENPSWPPESPALRPSPETEPYYVFQKQSQRRSMTYVTHVGEVEAKSAAEALQNALEKYGDNNAYVWWVCPARQVVRSSDEDIESMFAPAHRKTYRQPQEYKTFTQMKKVAGKPLLKREKLKVKSEK